MRWSCPHCGTGLGISDEKMGAGWSFSRCYKCGGYALVRRSEVNLVKVDRAPAGEPIILPESSEDPLISQEATERLSKYLKKREAPLPSPQRPGSSPPSFRPETAPSLPAPLPEMAGGDLPIELTDELATGGKSPARASIAQRLLPVGIGMAGAMAIGSGLYLVIQGEAIWEKTRTPSSSLSVESGEPALHPVSAINQERASPVKAVLNTAPHREGTDEVITDQVHQGAMAPTREQASVASGSPAPVPSPAAAPAPAPAPAAATAPATPATPPAALPRSLPQQQQTTLVVQPKAKNADIHAGPGSLYPRLGVANPEGRYLVADWNDRWFKIILADSRIGWIRTDLVHVVTARAEEKLPNDP